MLQVTNDYNIMHFKNDDEFYNFCVEPAIIINKCGCKGNCNESCCNECCDCPKRFYQDFPFTDEYVKAVNNGTHFMIDDEDSQIYKRGAVSYKSITKNVHNLMPYYNK